jgi:tryptophanase
VIEVVQDIYKDRERLKGMKIVWQPKALRHFSAHFEYL